MKKILLLALACCVMWTGLVSAHSKKNREDSYVFDNRGEGNKPQKRGNSSTSFNELVAGGASACIGGFAGGYPCNNIDLLSFTPNSAFHFPTFNANDLWGWTDSLTGKEYALLGREAGTFFLDVTDGVNPVYLGYLLTHSNFADSWRDIKVYQDHAFIVADGFGNKRHGMQVFDLTQLRGVTTPVQFAETDHFKRFGNAHNIAINEDTGYAYAVGSNKCSGGLFMIDISTPTDPVQVGCFDADGYTHDAQCVVYNGPDINYTGREICFAYNEDTVTIVDVEDKSNPVQLSSSTYPNAEYIHQGWLTDDMAFLLQNDELDEINHGNNTRTMIWDVSDLTNPIRIGFYDGPTPAIDHNLYLKDGLVYESNYRAGLRILDGSGISSAILTEIAYFDIIPSSDAPQFSGTWSNYPYFASGNIIVSDIEGGLFILKPTLP